MLRLEKLEMIGFKSFFARTEFIFHDRVTAIVGPNGCGKSNIGDALNWVIGEQSVKSLRGDRMEDVIFNGSETRKPLGMAEVSLHMRGVLSATGDEAGAATADEKLVISRRLFRSGESEYLLNGERCRLKDVQEALAKINLGSGLYAIIEQGKVDTAVSGKPRDRRALIEEAAGVAVYRARRRQAEGRLEATEANLLRVNDIVVELEKQIGSLKRQAARARRYSRTIEEIGRLERVLLWHDHKRLEAERAAAEAREDEARAREAGASARLSALDAELEERRRALEDRELQWRGRRDSLHGLDREIDRLERDRDAATLAATEAGAACEEARRLSATLGARVDGLQLQIDESRGRRMDLDRHVSSLALERSRTEEARRERVDRIERLESELTGRRSVFLQTVDALSDARNRHRQVEETRERIARQQGVLDREADEVRLRLETAARERGLAESGQIAAQDRLGRLRAGQMERREELGRLEETIARETARRQDAARRLHGQQERLKALREIEAESAGTREVLEGAVEHDGICVDRVTAPERIEAAAETFLEGVLDAALLRGRDRALAAIATLKSLGKGRAAFLAAPGHGQAGEEEPPTIAVPDTVRENASFVGRLADLVEVAPEWLEALRPVLARGLVVTDLESAFHLRRFAPFFDFVTLDGDIVRTTGLVEGGARRPEGTGRLARRRLIADLESGIEAGGSHLQSLDLLLQGLETDRIACAAAVADLAGSAATAEAEVAARKVSLQAAMAEEERSLAAARTVDQEKNAALEESAALAQELGRLAGSVADLELARRSGEAEIANSQEEIAQLRDSAAQAAEALAGVRATLSAASSKLEALDAELARLLDQDQDLRDRIEAERARAEAQAGRATESVSQAAAAASALVEASSRRAALMEAVREEEVALTGERQQLDDLSRTTREAREELERERVAREQATIEKERVAGDLRHLLSGVAAGEGPEAIENLFAGLSDEERLLDVNAIRATLDELRARRDGIGPVNMMALDQFRELEERYGFMTAQRKDLTDAIASLRDTIARINRTSRERFMEAFEKIRAGFIESFTTLFGGGRADLRLLAEEGEDLFDCGLEIVAQPPGKKLHGISLMSGGEKALTAIALLFAIFKYRPSPFCVLDEVDAPLDESNVLRFNQLLASMTESTQFVMITHNRRTMENANMLYGITMEEPGISRTMSVVVDGRTERSETIQALPALLAARHKGSGRRAPRPAAPEIAPVPAQVAEGNGHSRTVSPPGA